MDNNQIVVNGQLVSYLSTEKAGDKCLLFLHGWRSSKEVWLPLVHQVIKLSSYQVITMDLPGFGGSPPPREAWSVGDYAEVVKGFIEKLELKNVILVGHSFGGRVGIKLATTRPSSISKLVLVDSAGFVNGTTKKRVMELTAKLVKPFFLPKFMLGLRRKIYKAIGADDYVATPWLTETFIKVKNEDLTEDMWRIQTPTLIIWGENDQETPIEFLYKMKGLILNTKYQILKNAGHFSFLDKPGEFVKALIDFL